MKNIGFIGLGIMGAPMAQHLLKAGHKLFVYTRTAKKAEPVLAAGATWCDTPAAVGAECEILCTNVTDTPDVEAVLFGENGAVRALAAGSCVVDFSTISALATQAFAKRLAAREIALLDAPVTGGDVGAQNATLTIMVGGNPEAFERVRPLLEVVGKNIVHVGPSGSGQMLKACNQILCAVNMIGVCEALSLAKQSGLDLDKALKTLRSGAGGSWAWSNLGPKIAADDLDPAFMISLIQKDLRIVQEAGETHGVPLPGTAFAQQLFRAAGCERAGGERGTQAMILAYRKLMGTWQGR